MPLVYLGNGFGSLETSERQPKVFLMTLHSAKGLDFETVFLPRMGRGAPLAESRDADKHVDRQRRLLFVALTRSRRDLFVSFSGEGLHDAMCHLPGPVVISDFTKESSENDVDDDDNEGLI